MIRALLTDVRNSLSGAAGNLIASGALTLINQVTRDRRPCGLAVSETLTRTRSDKAPLASRPTIQHLVVQPPRARGLRIRISCEYGTSRALGVSAGEGRGSASALSWQASVKHLTYATNSLVIASRDRCSAGWVR
jgi:hypothetical protein